MLPPLLLLLLFLPQAAAFEFVGPAFGIVVALIIFVFVIVLTIMLCRRYRMNQGVVVSQGTTSQTTYITHQGPATVAQPYPQPSPAYPYQSCPQQMYVPQQPYPPQAPYAAPIPPPYNPQYAAYPPSQQHVTKPMGYDAPPPSYDSIQKSGNVFPSAPPG